MKRLVAPPLLTIFALLAATLALPSSARADLGDDVRKAIRNKAVKSDKVGVEIVRLGNPDRLAEGDGDGLGAAESIFSHNATTPLIPASNLKVVTTAAALELLGRDFRFRTALAVRGEDVAIVGDGDPTLGDAEMLRKLGWNVDTVFRNWADVLRKRGITTVRNVYVDDSVFDEVFVHPNWPVDQLHKRYVAQVG